VTALINLAWRYMTWGHGGSVIVGDEPMDSGEPAASRPGASPRSPSQAVERDHAQAAQPVQGPAAQPGHAPAGQPGQETDQGVPAIHNDTP
jgi:hypothetical protein